MYTSPKPILSVGVRTLAAIVCVAWIGVGHATESKRALRLDDGFAAEKIAEAAFSPDGQTLAVVRLRPVKDVRGYLQPVEGVRGDIWVQARPHQPLTAVTQGRGDGSGYWKLQWSPDGGQLAFLRAHGNTVTPWVWNRQSGTLQQVSTRSVDHDDGQPCRWVDSRRLLCLVAKVGEVIPPLEDTQGRHTEVMRRAWDKWLRGEVTASVLDSRFYDSPRGDLLLIDTATGTSRPLAEAFLSRDPVVPFGDSPSPWWLSPDGRTVAFIKPGPVPNVADGKLVFADALWRRPFTVVLRSIDGRDVALSRPLPEGIMLSSLSWSPDGAYLAFYTYDQAYADEGSLGARLWRISVRNGEVQTLDTEGLRLAWMLHREWLDADQGIPQFSPLLWTGTEQPVLLVRARRESAKEGSREDWWSLGHERVPQAVTPPLTVVPSEWAVRTGSVLVGLADGDVWRLDLNTGAVKNLTETLDEKVDYVYPPASNEAPSHVLMGTGPHDYVARVYAGDWGKPVDEAVTYELDLRNGTFARIEKPATDAGFSDTEVLAYSPVTRRVLYLQNNWSGTSLWHVEAPKGAAQSLLAANTFFRQIARPETRWFDYVSSEGVKRRGWVMLPHGYVAGRRYPTVVTVRMGSLGFQRERHLVPMHPAVGYMGSLTAAGYVVFSPDFDEGYQYRTTETDRALIRAGNDIHAALDAVVRQGYADPERFVIEGASGTGKSALNLITATNRFKAAVAFVMGPLPQFPYAPTWLRYSDYAHFYAGREGRNYAGMRYAQEEVRGGSILSHAGLVQTPVLLAHGDLDVIQMEYTEQYFNELVFRGKRAQFVRYWGEQHCLGCNNRANVADFLQRELAWFDEFADISRDATGKIVWDGNRVKSRNGGRALGPEDYERFEFFRASVEQDDSGAAAQEP